MSFTLWGLPGTLATLVAWAAAVVVFRTGPYRPLNRRLAVLLLVEGIWLSGSPSGWPRGWCLGMRQSR